MIEEKTYRSGKTLATTTAILLLLTAIANGTLAAFRIAEYFFFYPLTLEIENSSNYSLFLSVLGFLSLGVILVAYSTPVIFLGWQYRAAKNLRFLNDKAVSNSPGWNVGWWFIPFASLVMPLLCISELFNGSRSENALDKNYTADSSLTLLSGGWWFFYIVSGIMGMVTAFLALDVVSKPENMPSLINSMCFSHSFSIVAALLARKIVLSIENSQEESYKLFCEKHNSLAPPEPPQFD
jgi:hypothetical protein